MLRSFVCISTVLLATVFLLMVMTSCSSGATPLTNNNKTNITSAATSTSVAGSDTHPATDDTPYFFSAEDKHQGLSFSFANFIMTQVSLNTIANTVVWPALQNLITTRVANTVVTAIENLNEQTPDCDYQAATNPEIGTGCINTCGPTSYSWAWHLIKSTFGHMGNYNYGYCKSCITDGCHDDGCPDCCDCSEINIIVSNFLGGDAQPGAFVLQGLHLQILNNQQIRVTGSMGGTIYVPIEVIEAKGVATWAFLGEQLFKTHKCVQQQVVCDKGQFVKLITNGTFDILIQLDITPEKRLAMFPASQPVLDFTTTFDASCNVEHIQPIIKKGLQKAREAVSKSIASCLNETVYSLAQQLEKAIPAVYEPFPNVGAALLFTKVQSSANLFLNVTLNSSVVVYKTGRNLTFVPRCALCDLPAPPKNWDKRLHPNIIHDNHNSLLFGMTISSTMLSAILFYAYENKTFDLRGKSRNLDATLNLKAYLAEPFDNVMKNGDLEFVVPNGTFQTTCIKTSLIGRAFPVPFVNATMANVVASGKLLLDPSPHLGLQLNLTRWDFAPDQPKMHITAPKDNWPPTVIKSLVRTLLNESIKPIDNGFKSSVLLFPAICNKLFIHATMNVTQQQSKCPTKHGYARIVSSCDNVPRDERDKYGCSNNPPPPPPPPGPPVPKKFFASLRVTFSYIPVANILPAPPPRVFGDAGSSALLVAEEGGTTTTAKPRTAAPPTPAPPPATLNPDCKFDYTGQTTGQAIMSFRDITNCLAFTNINGTAWYMKLNSSDQSYHSFAIFCTDNKCSHCYAPNGRVGTCVSTGAGQSVYGYHLSATVDLLPQIVNKTATGTPAFCIPPVMAANLDQNYSADTSGTKTSLSMVTFSDSNKCTLQDNIFASERLFFLGNITDRSYCFQEQAKESATSRVFDYVLYSSLANVVELKRNCLVVPPVLPFQKCVLNTSIPCFSSGAILAEPGKCVNRHSDMLQFLWTKDVPVCYVPPPPPTPAERLEKAEYSIYVVAGVITGVVIVFSLVLDKFDLVDKMVPMIEKHLRHFGRWFDVAIVASLVSFIKNRASIAERHPNASLHAFEIFLEKRHTTHMFVCGVFFTMLYYTWIFGDEFSRISMHSVRELGIPGDIDISPVIDFFDAWKVAGGHVAWFCSVACFFLAMLPYVLRTYLSNKTYYAFGTPAFWEKVRCFSVTVVALALIYSVVIPPMLLADASKTVTLKKTGHSLLDNKNNKAELEEVMSISVSTLSVPLVLYTFVMASSGIAAGSFVGVIMRASQPHLDPGQEELRGSLGSVAHLLVVSMTPFIELLVVITLFRSVQESYSWLILWLIHAAFSLLSAMMLPAILRGRYFKTAVGMSMFPLVLILIVVNQSCIFVVHQTFFFVLHLTVVVVVAITVDSLSLVLRKNAENTAATARGGGEHGGGDDDYQKLVDEDEDDDAFHNPQRSKASIQHDDATEGKEEASRLRSTPSSKTKLAATTAASSSSLYGSTAAATSSKPVLSNNNNTPQQEPDANGDASAQQQHESTTTGEHPKTKAAAATATAVAVLSGVADFVSERIENQNQQEYGLRTRFRRMTLLVGSVCALIVSVDALIEWYPSDPRNEFASMARHHGVNITNGEKLPIDNVFVVYKQATGVQARMQIAGALSAVLAFVIESWQPSTRKRLDISRYFVAIAFLLFSLSVVATAWPDYIAASNVDSLFPPCAPKFDAAVRWLFRTIVGMYFSVQVMTRTFPVLMIFPPAADRIIYFLCAKLYPNQPHLHTRLAQVVSLVTPAMNAVPLMVITQFFGTPAIKGLAALTIMALPFLALLVELFDFTKKSVQIFVMSFFVFSYWLPWILLLNQCAHESDTVSRALTSALTAWQTWLAFVAEISLSTVALGDMMSAVLVYTAQTEYLAKH